MLGGKIPPPLDFFDINVLNFLTIQPPSFLEYLTLLSKILATKTQPITGPSKKYLQQMIQRKTIFVDTNRRAFCVNWRNVCEMRYLRAPRMMSSDPQYESRFSPVSDTKHFVD